MTIAYALNNDTGIYQNMPIIFKGCETVLKLAEIAAHAKSCPCKPPLALDPKVSQY